MALSATAPVFAALRNVLGVFALPPIVLLLVALAGAVLAWRGRRAGGAVAVVCLAATLLLATPMVSGLLLASLEETSPAGVGGAPEAIIILGAEANNGQDGPDVGPLTLERLRRGAALQRVTGLPLLVSGGPVGQDGPPLADAMRESLVKDFAVPVQWQESHSLNTGDNLRLAAGMLNRTGIGSAYLVTHSWHMRRARLEAARVGLTVVPMVVPRPRRPNGRLTDWFPRADYLAMSWLALREWTGLAAMQAGL